MTSEIFPFLIIGVTKYLEDRLLYPYPNELRYIMNQLLSEEDYVIPKTISGFFNQCKSPLQDWYPFELPTIDPSASLISRDGSLTEQAQEYFDTFVEETDLPYKTSLNQLEIIIDNRLIYGLKKRLEEAYEQNPKQAQQEYVKARVFIIKHPFTTQQQIEETFEFGRYINDEYMIQFYTSVDKYNLLTYPDSKYNNSLTYVSCAVCGALYSDNNEPCSIKPKICEINCPKEDGWHSYMNRDDDVLVLRRGIQLRTHIPGIPELNLYDWLVNLSKKYPDLIRSPELYPNIDAYDIRIIFEDAVWAVDVKDYADPYQLAEKLTGLPRQGDLKYQRAFYVYPTYRAKSSSIYHSTLMNNSKDTRKDALIYSDENFRGLVIDYLNELGAKI